MIKLIRQKGPLKILELRYPKELIEDKKFDTIKLYSFKNLRCKKGWNKTNTCTMQIDLVNTKEEIWKNMSKQYRKHIRTEELKNIKISRLKDYKNFYKILYLPLCKRNKLKPYPLKYLQQGDLWTAKLDGGLLSGSIIFNDNKNSTQSFTASEHIEYNGNRFLIWKAIQYYKSKGLKEFNFGGGFSDFKRRFGSEKKDVWLYTKYLSKKAKFLNKLRNTFKI